MRFFLMTSALIFFMACGGSNENQQTVSETDQPEEVLKLADQYYASEDYENAFLAYGIIYYNYPTSREYIDAAIGLSRSYGALENYEKQFDILFTLLRENLIPSKVPEIYNAIAEFYEKSAGISEQLRGEGSADYKTAIDYYTKSIDYPNSDDLVAKSLAQYRIGKLYEKLDDFSMAIKAHQTTMNRFSGTEWALRSEQSLGDIRTRVDRRNEYQQNSWFNTSDSTGIKVPDAVPDSIPQPAVVDSSRS